MLGKDPAGGASTKTMGFEEAAFHYYSGLRLVKRLPANLFGRDFVVGDLHGCKKELDRLLQLVEFDRRVDRLISVGDLVDRGPKSLDCLLLLKATWFHAVMGNHEQLLLNFYDSWLANGSPPDPYSEAGVSFLVNGGEWALLEGDARLRPAPPLSDLLPLVSALPQIIVVGEGEERYNVVHAEFSKTIGPDGELSAWTDAEIDRLPAIGSNGQDYPEFRWSRRFMGNTRRLARLPVRAEGLSMTFCGHTVGFGVRRALSHVCLDTGAFVAYREETPSESYGLTLADVKARRWMTIRDLCLSDGEF
jgi:serine/threonine protein phosphatase 1